MWLEGGVDQVQGCTFRLAWAKEPIHVYTSFYSSTFERHQPKHVKTTHPLQQEIPSAISCLVLGSKVDQDWVGLHHVSPVFSLHIHSIGRFLNS